MVLMFRRVPQYCFYFTQGNPPFTEVSVAVILCYLFHVTFLLLLDLPRQIVKKNIIYIKNTKHTALLKCPEYNPNKLRPLLLTFKFHRLKKLTEMVTTPNIS